MTIFRAPLTDNKGDIRVAQVATGAVPAQATQFRGLWVTMNGLVCGTPDTGQDRVFQGGIAFEASSGLMLLGDGSATPFKMPMDGMLVDANGAFLGGVGAGQVIHQGVNFINQSTGGNPRVNTDDPVLTFQAGLEYQSNSGSIEATQTRDSEATYWAQDGRLAVAAVDEIRQEFQNGQPLGTLMEPPATNKCQDYNAERDAALTGLVPGGDASAVISRIQDTEALVAAGLDRVCSSGFVIKIDNTAGSTPAYVLVDGQAGNLNPHQCGVWWRGSGNGRIQTTGPTGPSASIPAAYERYSVSQTPSAATNRLMIQAEAGAILYFLLNRFVEETVASSDIITQGAAGVRALDELSWSLTDPQGRNILNQAAGMAAVVWRPLFANTDVPENNKQTLVSFLADATTETLMSARTIATTAAPRFFTNDGTLSAEVDADWDANKDHVVSTLWQTNLQIGRKKDGTWAWSPTVLYDGAFSTAGVLRLAGLPTWGPVHLRSLYLWAENKGTAWLESFFSGVAN